MQKINFFSHIRNFYTTKLSNTLFSFKPKKHNLIPFVLLILLLFTILSPTFVLATDSTYVWSNNVSSNTSMDSLETSSNSKSSNNLNLESASAILIEQNSGKVLYEHNSHEKLRPASVTKVMSLLLIMEAIDSGQLSYTDKISCSEKARSMGGSQIWLDETEELTVDEMLKAICIVSANDCVVAMAEHISGSEEAFVEKMNEKAKTLGMNDTTFKNCHGIDEDGHVTSSYDIAIMSRELLKNHPDITKYTTIWMDSLRDGKSELVNTNKLLRNYSGATGLKTGSTSLALYNLSASATRNNLSLIAVIMKAPTSAIRFSEAKKLLDYGFNTYEYKELGKENDIISTISITKGVETSVDVCLSKNAGILIKKGEAKNINQNINLPESISAPIKKGQVIGKLTYSNDSTELLSIDLVANKDINKMNIGNMITHLYKSWFCLNRQVL